RFSARGVIRPVTRASAFNIRAWRGTRVRFLPGNAIGYGAPRMPGTGRLRVCAHRHRAHRQRRPGLHGRAHQFDVVVELPAVDRGQLAQRFHGDLELAAGATLVPHATHNPIDEQHRVVAGLARRGEGAPRGRAWVQARPRLTDDHERIEVGKQPDPSERFLWYTGVASECPSRLAVEDDLLKL